MINIGKDTYFIAYQIYTDGVMSATGYRLVNIYWEDVKQFDTYIQNIIKDIIGNKEFIVTAFNKVL